MAPKLRISRVKSTHILPSLKTFIPIEKKAKNTKVPKTAKQSPVATANVNTFNINTKQHFIIESAYATPANKYENRPFESRPSTADEYYEIKKELIKLSDNFYVKHRQWGFE